MSLSAQAAQLTDSALQPAARQTPASHTSPAGRQLLRGASAQQQGLQHDPCRNSYAGVAVHRAPLGHA